jgi:hypothetical protein
MLSLFMSVNILKPVIHTKILKKSLPTSQKTDSIFILMAKWLIFPQGKNRSLFFQFLKAHKYILWEKSDISYIL